MHVCSSAASIRRPHPAVNGAGPPALLYSAPMSEPRAGARPNILWISVEDIDPLLGCYGAAAARRLLYLQLRQDRLQPGGPGAEGSLAGAAAHS